MSNNVKVNRALSTGIPEINRDVLRPSDYVVDKAYPLSVFSAILGEIFSIPCILDGLEVTPGTGDTINISAGRAIIEDAEVTSIRTNNNDGLQIATDIPINPYAVLVEYIGGSNIPMPVGASAGVNKVLLKYKPTSFLERVKRADVLTTYAAFTKDGVEVLIVPEATILPHTIEIGRFTGITGLSNFRGSQYLGRTAKLNQLNFPRKIWSIENDVVLELGSDFGKYILVEQDLGWEATFKHQDGVADKLIINPEDKYSDIKDKSGCLNIYVESGIIKLQNKTGTLRTVFIYNYNLS